jgi:hypothetical protein
MGVVVLVDTDGELMNFSYESKPYSLLCTPPADRTSLIQKTYCHSFHSIGEANFFSADVFDELEASKTSRRPACGEPSGDPMAAERHSGGRVFGDDRFQHWGSLRSCRKV